MSSIVIYTSGTLGDHLPFIALGRALHDRGHRVQLAVNPAMQSYVHRAGLETFVLTDEQRGEEQARADAWAWDHWNNRDTAEHPKAKPFDIEQHVTQARELIALCRDADLLIATSIRMLGYVVHHALGVPWLTASMNPFSFWQSTAEEERRAHQTAEIKIYRSIKELLGYTFSSLGIDHAVPIWSRGWLFARHILLASSAYFSKPDLKQLLPRSSIDMTGFWFYEDPDWLDWQPDEALREFAARRPIVLAFSSQPLENPQHILAVHVEAAALLGQPLLVQRGWAGFAETDLPQNTRREDVMFVDYLPHDWLFAQAACAIQHGGIGSIARALRQGCPLVIEPFGNDQLYNASRVVNLGVGVAMHPFKMTGADLAQVLSAQVLTPQYRQRAADLGALLREEDGLETACWLIETYLERIQSGEEMRLKAAVPLFRNRYQPNIDIPFAAFAKSGPVDQPTGIPKIIHQTWKEANLPANMAATRRTWLACHPDWTHYLWTDEDNREFLRRYYPWFLSIYDAYPEPIMRADAVRYFILYHYGGVYADLDTEALRPLDPLIVERDIILGLEPERHVRTHQIHGYPLPRIVSNAVMISAPGHPFWEQVFRHLVSYHHANGALDATGPFLLTRAYESYPGKGSVPLEQPGRFFPVDNETPWSELSPAERANLGRVAYVVHHWWGSWWRAPAAQRASEVKVSLATQGQITTVSNVQLESSVQLFRRSKILPRVSCLMVTAKREHLARRAIHCFRNQTYANTELIIVDDGDDDALLEWVLTLNDERIIYVRLPSAGQSLGELRNIAVSRASGEYIAQWDDDDLSDPTRLEVQLALIDLFHADACTLDRQMIWWPAERRLAVSVSRVWESALVCARNILPSYPEQVQGEDTPVVEHIFRTGRVALLDMPFLYTYVFHGANTFAANHWEEHWRAAAMRFEGEHYNVTLHQLQERMGLNLGSWLADAPAGRQSPAAEESIEPAPILSRAPEQEPTPSRLARNTGRVPHTQPASPATFPKVLILTPVKDAARFLAHYWDQLCTLTYPHDRISVAFLESDSSDGTYALIASNLAALEERFARVTCFKRDYQYRSLLPRWEPSEQFRRRSIMAKSRNYLLAQGLRDEDWVLWIDVDVSHWPTDVIEQLLAAEKDIIVPNCLSAQTGETFDFNTFKLEPGAETWDWSPYILDGILQPPKGFGRLYLSDLREHNCVELDAVGGTMLLIRADLHREGLVFPPFSYKHHIETEGLALMAKDMGYSSWGLPNLQIFHP